MPRERRLLLAKQALSKSYLGQKGLIEVVDVDGKLKFKSTYIDPLRLKAGQSAQFVSDSIEEVAQPVSSFGLTELVNIEPGTLGPSTYRGYGQVLMDINEALGLTGDQQYGAQIKIHKAEAGSESIGKFLQDMKNQKAGLIFPTDEGGMALSLRQGDRVLSMEETLEAMSKGGRPLFTPDELDKALKGGNEGLSKLFAKLPKRLKGVLSPRDISISGDLMKSFLSKPTVFGPKGIMDELSQATLAMDNVFETIALGFDQDTAKNFALGTKQFDVRAFMEESFQYKGGGTAVEEASSYVNNVLDEIIKSRTTPTSNLDKTKILNSLENLVKDIIRDGKNDSDKGIFGTNEIKKFLNDPNNSSLIDDETSGVIKSLLDELEKGRDGSSLINTKFASELRKTLHQELGSLTQNRDEQSMIRKVELRRQLSELNIKDGEAIGLSQGTVRGSVRIGGVDYSYKSAAQFKNFSKRFEKYGIITSISGLKKETGIAAGTPVLNLSGLAESTSRVYTDPMLASFHDAIFGNTEDIAISSKYSRNVLDEFKGILESGRLTDNSEVLQGIKKLAQQDIEQFAEPQQFSKMLNRDFAQRILDLHRSGISINDSPEYLNLLKKYYEAELYKTKNGQRLPVVGDVYRFALNSEANAMTGTTGRKTLSGKSIDIDPTKILSGKPIKVTIGEAGDEISAQIAQFRVSNHNILFHEDDIRKFYHALGGFDLDDKGLPILGTYMSEGKRRLGAAMVRQPTSMGEVIGLTRFEDIESYREIFGGNRFFMKTLDEMAKGDSKFLGLKMAFDGSGVSDDVINSSMMGTIEQLTIEVNDILSGAKFDNGVRTGGMRDFNKNFFKKLGVFGTLDDGTEGVTHFSATKLIALGDQDPGLMSLGFQRLVAEVAEMPLEQEVLSSLDSMSLISRSQKSQLQQMTKELKDQRKNRLNLGGVDLEDADREIQSLSDKFYKTVNALNISPEQKSIALGKSFINKSIDSAIENTNILGQYINRATVVGHGLRQMEDMLGTIPGIQEDLINKKLMLAFTPAETVIDMTQTFTSGRMLLGQTTKLANGDPNLGVKVLKELYGKETNLNDFGDKTMQQYGKMFGYLRQKHKLDGMDPMDPRKALVLDEAFLTSKKMNKNDLINFARSLSAGMLEADNAADVTDINKAVESQQYDEVEKVLRARGIIAKGSLSEIVDVANTSNYYLEAMAKLGRNAQISQEQELVSRTSERSRIAAEKILDENQERIKAVQSLADEIQSGSFAESSKIALEIKKIELGDNLLRNLQDVQKSMGISGYELTSALQYGGLRRKIAPEFFTKLPDSSTNIDNESLNLFHRYMQMSDQKAIYEKSTKNLQLRQYVDDIFGNMSDTQKAGIMDDALDLDFADDFFGTGKTSSVISSIIKGQAEEGAGTMEEQQIARALRNKTAFELNAQADKEAAAFLNGDLASSRILSSADDITETTPGVVADTLRDLSQVKKSTASQSMYKRMNKQYLAEQFAKPGVRNAAIGAGIAIAASFLYQNKKDHTQEAMSGPPLLPGGSAYESDYPKRMSEIPQARGQGFTAGMNYKVSLFGDRDQIQKFSAAASGLTNGSINSTMYNRIPDVARDPYQSIARSY
jgi:hypothetical protein